MVFESIKITDIYINIYLILKMCNLYCIEI